MTPNNPTTFKLTFDFQIGQRVWHRANRDMSGMVDAVVLYGRDEYRYRISWGTIECSEERETTLTDEPPTFDTAADN